MYRNASERQNIRLRHGRSTLLRKCTRSPWIFGVIVLCLISHVEARKSQFWRREDCLAETLEMQGQSGFNRNTSEYFLMVNGLLYNGRENMTLTLKGCHEFCGSWTWYWDSGPRITTWIIPVLLLLSNIELSPIDKKRFMTITHALGDPVDSFWSVIHKIYIWHRLYAIGWNKSGPAMAKKEQGPHPPDNADEDPSTTRSPLGADKVRSERARIIATVLAGFEEVSGARIISEDYYHMVVYQLGRIGEPDEDPVIFEQWRRAARILADARTNEFLRTCLAIFVYLFGLIAAFVPKMGGGNTSPPGGRIGSAIFLSWLVPLALLTNIVGTFTSRRSCLTIMRQFVGNVRSYQDGRTQSQDQSMEAEADHDDVAPDVRREDPREAPGAVQPIDLEGKCSSSEPNSGSSEPGNPADAIQRNAEGGNLQSAAPPGDGFANQNTRWQGHLDPTTVDRIDLMRKTTWELYFDSLQWLGAIYTYRPWKVLYLDIDRRTYAHRKNVLMVLAGFFPVLVSATGAFVIIWYAVPVGFSCRHTWVLGIFVLWLLSAAFTTLTYVRNKDHPTLTGHDLWRRVLIKDAIVGISCLFIIFMSTGGLFNNCYCWSAYMMRRKESYVTLNTEDRYIENAKYIYSIIVATTIGTQIAFFGVLLWWWRRGVGLVRWTEKRRRREWAHEMRAEEIEKTDDTFMLFWYNQSELDRQHGRRMTEYQRYSVSQGRSPRV